MKNSAIGMASLLLIFILNATEPIYAEQFFCQSGDVTCLIAAINTANGTPSQHTIKLAPGIYTLQAAVESDTGLPIIKGSIKITATSDTDPNVIERSPTAGRFRIFQVAPNGELILEGITAQRGRVFGIILNFGSTTLRDSIVTLAMDGDFVGAIRNLGTLNVIRSIIADNGLNHHFGGIGNEQGGTVLIENSTIAHNSSDGCGGICNDGGVVVVRNSAIVFNSAGGVQVGGGIDNEGGSVTITNSTIAENFANGGGGIYNGNGVVSITNATIRENQTVGGSFGAGGSGILTGIFNLGGIVQIQNTIVAGNTFSIGPGKGPDCRGTITSLGNNVIGDLSDCDVTLQPSDIVGDPGLGPLVGTGEDEEPGKVFYPVLAGSPVINAGNKQACPNKDQLGNNREGKCDIGAVEFQP